MQTGPHRRRQFRQRIHAYSHAPPTSDLLHPWSVLYSLSLPNLIQEAIDHLLRSVVTPSKAEQKERALAIAGRFKSGLGDLARHHDDYVAEAFEA